MGKLYTLRICEDGSAGRLRKLYESGPDDGPDKFAVGSSGRIYLNLFLANQVAVISPEGKEITRIRQRNTRNPKSFAILDIAAKERGQKLFRPSINPIPNRVRANARSLAQTATMS